MLVSVCTKIDNEMPNIIFLGYNLTIVICKTSLVPVWNQSKPVEKTRQQVTDHLLLLKMAS